MKMCLIEEDDLFWKTVIPLIWLHHWTDCQRCGWSAGLREVEVFRRSIAHRAIWSCLTCWIDIRSLSAAFSFTAIGIICYDDKRNNVHMRPSFEWDFTLIETYITCRCGLYPIYRFAIWCLGRVYSNYLFNYHKALTSDEECIFYRKPDPSFRGKDLSFFSNRMSVPKNSRRCICSSHLSYAYQAYRWQMSVSLTLRWPNSDLLLLRKEDFLELGLGPTLF